MCKFSHRIIKSTQIKLQQLHS